MVEEEHAATHMLRSGRCALVVCLAKNAAVVLLASVPDQLPLSHHSQLSGASRPLRSVAIPYGSALQEDGIRAIRM